MTRAERIEGFLFFTSEFKRQFPSTDLQAVVSEVEEVARRGQLARAMTLMLPFVRMVVAQMSPASGFLLAFGYRFNIARAEIEEFFGYGEAKTTTDSVPETANHNRWY